GQNEVWIYLDAEDRGVNLDECAEVSRELGFLMDAHDLFEIKYRLNVSSTGLSRPLSDYRQYKKNIGRFVKIKTRTPEDGFSKLEGLLTDVLDEAIHIKNDNGSTTMVPRSDIYETKIIPKI
ncbi:MAG: ribosome maturation factor, partial [Bacteroidota bacterium]